MNTFILVALTLNGLLIGLLFAMLSRRKRLPPARLRLTVIFVVSALTLILLYVLISTQNYIPEIPV